MNAIQVPQAASSPHTSADRLPAHVVLLTNFIPPYRLPLYRELSRRVARLTVLVSTPMERNRNWTADWRGLEVEVQRGWSMERPWRHRQGFRDKVHVHLPWDTLERLRRLRPDVVLSAELGFRSLMSALYQAERPDAALVLWAMVSEHTEQGRGAARQMLRHWLLRRADRVVVNGQSGARYVRRFGVADQRIDRVPYTAAGAVAAGVTAGERARHRSAPEFDLLCVGQLIERKGIVPLVEQLAAWVARHPQRPVRLAIAGSGPLRERIETRPLPAQLTICCLGELGHDQLAAVYARSGALVMPSLADEWGLVVNEALAAGLPVLGSVYSQAVEELLVDGRNGWLYRPDDAGQVQRALDRVLLAQRRKLRVMGWLARRSVRHLTPDWAAERLVQSLRAALRSRRPNSYREA
ncbi:MAG: glycosyltransferase family 4 protein [Pirellulaceae bacterium]|nr:glycosyltransferase family 4 protein [Pirellulaceae bacterium]